MAMTHAGGTAATSAPLRGKVAVVIGGGRGIGRETARRLASAGARVVVAARTASQLEAVVVEITALGGEATAVTVDVTRPESVQLLAHAVRKAHGHVDVLVNSAGDSHIAPLDATSEADWDRVIDTNLKGPYLCIRAMLDLLRASPGAQVVNIASKVGLTGHAQVTAYTAAKAGLIGFSRALALELKPENIRVVVICPGPVDTPMRWAATPNLDPSMVMSTETIAETILFAVTLGDRAALSTELVIEAVGYQESAVPLPG